MGSAVLCVQSAARIPRALWLAHFQTLLGDWPPSLPCPPAAAVPLEAQATAAGEAGDPAPGSAAMAKALHAPFTAGEVEAAIRHTRGRACVVGPLKPTVLSVWLH